ncbi:MAG: hypothetical protein ACOYNN_04090 [Terrimicrobiaceae bacterium]
MRFHTKDGGKKDFRVVLDGAPTGYCFHASCQGEVEAFNKELRRRIWLEEKGDAPINSAWSGVAAAPKQMKTARPEINRTLLAEHTRGVPVISKDWLRRRSPVDVVGVSPGQFLDALFEPKERVLVFSSQMSQGDFLWWAGKGGFRLAQERGVKAVRSELPPGGPDGIWYLVQPVTGLWEVKQDVKWSGEEKKTREVRATYTRRSKQNVTAWRHFVLESDVLQEEEWLRVIVAIGIPIVAIYTSGKRSVHALLRWPMESKAVWDATRDALRTLLCPLGADPAALSAVRLSRLPGCRRDGRMQELLWLSPGAEESQRIMLMPEVRE